MDRPITLQGMPKFNDDDWRYVIEDIEGWDDGVPIEASLVPNGGGDGAVAVGVWTSPERYITVSGSVDVSASDHTTVRRQLLSAFPYRSGSAPIVVDENGAAVQMFCRRYDKVSVNRLGMVTTFELPLVAPDPFRYGLTELGGTIGVWTGDAWFRQYAQDGGTGPWFRRYRPDLAGDDPSFESGTNGYTSDADWTIETDTAHAHRGQQALKATALSASPTPRTKVIALDPGTYTVAAWVWIPTAASFSEVSLRAGGDTDEPKTGPDVKATRDEWVRIVHPFTINSGSLTLYLWSTGAASGDEIWWDDLTIVPGDVTDPPEPTAGWFRRYVQDDPAGSFPESIALHSDGTVVSDRVTVELVGPLTGGDWRLINESTGEIMWLETDLLAGQTVLFDSHAKTVTLQGTPVPELFFGDWLTLPPGQSVFRLTSDTQTVGHANITALEAYE